MERQLRESYLTNPAARLARLAELQETLRMIVEDRPDTKKDRQRQREMIAALRQEIDALGGPVAGLAAPDLPAPPAPAATPAPAPPAPAPAPVAPAPAPAAPTAPAVLDPNATVSVNPDNSIFYPQGTRFFGHAAPGWRQMTAAQAVALGARATRFNPSAAANIPSGVYEVERPTRGDPRIVIRSFLDYRQVRARLEQAMVSAGQYAVRELLGYQRAHSQGPGLGVESGEAIRLAPEFVNQALQNRGIEQFLRDLRDIVLQEGDAIHMTTSTETIPNTLRLKSIEYQIEIRRGDSVIPVGDVSIEVEMNGRSRAGVRKPGSDTYIYTPIYDVDGNPVR
jgi:hypothetical protein